MENLTRPRFRFTTSRCSSILLLLCITTFLALALSGCGSPLPTPRDQAHLHWQQGFDYYEDGLYSHANVEFTSAIELDPEFADAYLGRGHAYQGLGQWEAAVENFDKAIELDATMPAAVYVSRGNAHNQLEQWQKAIEDFDHAIELEAGDDSDQAMLILALKGRGRANIGIGNGRQAYRDFQLVLALDPNDPEAEDVRAILRILDSDISEAADLAGLCSWFAESQLLRATRMSGLTKFTSFLRTYGTADLTSADQAVLSELAAALEEYLPYEREFIKKWEQLGSEPGAEVFWEKELEAEKQKLSAFTRMLDGLKNVDDTTYLAALEEFQQAALIGRESESAMMEIRGTCLEGLK